MSKILLVGNQSLVKEEYVNSNIIVHNNEFINKLYMNNEVDNISKASLTIKSAYNMVDIFTNNYKYNYCVIDLGDAENDSLKSSEYKEYLQKLIDMLLYRRINLILLDSCTRFSAVIQEVKRENKLSSNCLTNTLSFN